MKYPNVIEEKVLIGDISALVFKPEKTVDNPPGVVFYHGWSSNKDVQRFRAYIISSCGYVVILPDSIYHGERGSIDYSKKENGPTFWKVVLSNLREWSQIKEYLINEYKVDRNRIAVSGHSMGGFTSAGIFAADTEISSLIVHNGSCNWGESNDIFKRELGFSDVEEFEELEEIVLENDPMTRLKYLKDRPILLLHGDSDSVVDIKPQLNFYNSLMELYGEKDRLKMITYKNLNHYLTTGMLEEMILWLKKHL